MDIYEAKMAALVVSWQIIIRPFELFSSFILWKCVEYFNMLLFSISDEGKPSSRSVGSESSCAGSSRSSYFTIQVSEGPIGSRGMAMFFGSIRLHSVVVGILSVNYACWTSFQETYMQFSEYPYFGFIIYLWLLWFGFCCSVPNWCSSCRLQKRKQSNRQNRFDLSDKWNPRTRASIALCIGTENPSSGQFWRKTYMFYTKRHQTLHYIFYWLHQKCSIFFSTDKWTASSAKGGNKRGVCLVPLFYYRRHVVFILA